MDHDKNLHVITDRAVRVRWEHGFDWMIVYFTLLRLSFIVNALGWNLEYDRVAANGRPEPVRALQPGENRTRQ